MNKNLELLPAGFLFLSYSVRDNVKPVFCSPKFYYHIDEATLFCFFQLRYY